MEGGIKGEGGEYRGCRGIGEGGEERRGEGEGVGRGRGGEGGPEEVKEAFPVTHFDIITRCVTHYSHLQCYVTSYCTPITKGKRELLRGNETREMEDGEV